MFLKPQSILVREYAGLGQPWVTQVATTPFKNPPRLIHLNPRVCDLLHVNEAELADTYGVNVLSGNLPWPEYSSVASVYCGHQFGVFVPQLGDGRAIVISEIRSGRNCHQIQLKGAGPTPYSRHADGRAVLRSSIREYLASEAMHQLGIPTTRALSITTCNDAVIREDIEPAAVVARVSENFLRFGHVEYFSYTNQHDALRELLSWHIERHHPEIDLPGDDESQFRKGLFQWFDWVIKNTAKLIAQWQTVGFCHGVMNTDNMSLLGLTIDYGPYGFLDATDVAHICNHSDQNGRYSYNNQPRIGHWNLYALGQALMPLLGGDQEAVQVALDGFVDEFRQYHANLFMAKLGAESAATAMALEEKESFIENTLKFLHTHRIDFTRFFRSLSALNPTDDFSSNFANWQQSPFFAIPLGDEQASEEAKQWLGTWITCLRTAGVGQSSEFDLINWRQVLNETNPAFILRNHLLQVAIERSTAGDDTEVQRLFDALSKPYAELPGQSDLYGAPPEWAKDLTLSCSS